MAQHYRTGFTGTCEGQEIVNVFYASRSDGTPVESSITALDDLHAAYVANLVPEFLAYMTSLYTLRSMVTTIVDENNEVQSTFPYETPVNMQGARIGNIDGAGRCLIIGIRCGPNTTGQTARVPRRSYIAYGPILSEDILSNGDAAVGLMTAGQTLADAIANFNANVGNDAYDVSASRVGVRNAMGVGAEGRAVIAIPRPVVRNRNSRTRSATGR